MVSLQTAIGTYVLVRDSIGAARCGGTTNRTSGHGHMLLTYTPIGNMTLFTLNNNLFNLYVSANEIFRKAILYESLEVS